MKKFEYKFVKIVTKSFAADVEQNEANLIELGLQGWRLSCCNTSGGSVTHYIMERQIAGNIEVRPSIDELV